MRRITTALVAALTVTALAVAPAEAGHVPLPADDPFYKVPRGIADLRNGTVLKSRKIDPAPLGLPIPANAWQVQYKSLNTERRPIAAVTTVLVPKTPWPEDGPRPLLSYQSAINGVSLRCAPSYAMRAGQEAGSNNSALESATYVRLALARGWAVSVPDHLGPRSTYGARASGYHTLDGIQAAKDFAPAGIDRKAPVGLWGYSGGAVASSQAANLMRKYAPKLRIAGIALGGLPADFRASLKSFDGSVLFGLVLLAIIGLDRAHTDIDLASYATKKGKRALAAEQDNCANDVTTKYAFEKMSDYIKDPRMLDRPEIKALIKYNSPIGMTGNPRAPVYSYHSVNDQVAPVARNRGLMRRYCAAGVPVQQYEDYASEHISLVATGGPAAFAYLADRFAGKPAPSTCGSAGLLP